MDGVSQAIRLRSQVFTPNPESQVGRRWFRNKGTPTHPPTHSPTGVSPATHQSFRSLLSVRGTVGVRPRSGDPGETDTDVLGATSGDETGDPNPGHGEDKRGVLCVRTGRWAGPTVQGPRATQNVTVLRPRGLPVRGVTEVRNEKDNCPDPDTGRYVSLSRRQ